MTTSGHDVLVVEDNTVLCEEMASVLERTGLRVATAHDGESALAQATAGAPKVVLLDYNLPDCNGLELAERLRQALPETAMLLMSGNIDGVSEEALRRIGIRVFLNKPVPLRALRDAVTKLARQPANRRGPQQGNVGWLSSGLGGTRR